MNNEQLKELKDKVCKAILDARSEIIDLGEDIFKHPELGFKETRTSQLVASKLEELGLNVEKGLAITGVKAESKGKNHNAKVCVMGELDAVVSPQHPCADPKTGAAHSCGHHAQAAAMVGAAIGLIKSGVINELDGDVVFLGVPAEEYVELAYRKGLRESGKIQFFGGKQELIRDGFFDDIDAVMMVHSQADTPGKKAFMDLSFNGFIGKIATYIGKAAHAGGEPHKGINALNAAMIGLSAINAQRETFQDNDNIRVHPIITKGGDLVNIVPDEVIIESYVRASNMNAILDSNIKVNRALKAGAYAVGGECQIEDMPGYLPLKQDSNLSKIFASNMAELIGAENVLQSPHSTGSSDMGDLSCIVPSLHPMTGGFSGTAHGRDFNVADPDMAYVIPAQAMAMTVVDLLVNQAEKAKEVKANFNAPLTKESFLKLWEDLLSNK